VGHLSYQISIVKLKTLNFRLAASADVVSVEVVNLDEMTWGLNTFILAVNSKLIISHEGREYYNGYKKMIIIHHNGGNNRCMFLPGNDDKMPFLAGLQKALLAYRMMGSRASLIGYLLCVINSSHIF
jgi:hypothetical protein